MTRPIPDAEVVVPLTPYDVGWPPMATERLWATRLGEDRYRIETAPWFTRDLAVGDVVLARATGIAPGSGQDAMASATFVEVLERSEHVTLRLIVNPPGTLAEVAQELTPLGVRAEGFPHYSMLAVDVPPEADVEAVARAIDEGQREGRWNWEEGRTTPRWMVATLGF